MPESSASNPSVDILLGAYNGQNFIREQIDSIFAQTDQDWRLILSDDGSNDKTPQILREYAESCPNQCVFFQSGRHFGNPTAHSLHLIKRSSADIIFWCDQDDFWYPDKVETFRREMLTAESRYGKETPILVFSDLVPVDESMKPLEGSFVKYQKMYVENFDFRSLLLQNVVSANSMAVNHAAVDRAFGAVDPNDILMTDWWLAVVCARFGKVVYIPKAMGVYRQHQSNRVGAKHVGSPEYILSNMRKLSDVKDSLRKKKLQAGHFRKYYGDELTANELDFLKEFEKERSGPFFYWKNRQLIHSRIRLAGMMALG